MSFPHLRALKWWWVDQVELQHDYAALASVWDSLVLREGDQSAVHAVASCSGAYDRWSTAGFLRMAWEEASNRSYQSRGTVGIQNSNRSSEARTLLAGFSSAVAKSTLDDMRWDRVGALLLRHGYDATPMMMWFGILQAVLEPVARYPILETDELGRQRWKVVPFDKYKEVFPRALTSKGSIEVLAQKFDIFFSTRDGTASGLEEQHQRHIICPPMLLKSGNANCIAEATARGAYCFSPPGIKELCQIIPWVFLSDSPDSAKANKRHSAYRMHELLGIPNALYFPGYCNMHHEHRIAVKGTAEEDLVGHSHALWTVFSDTTHKQTVLKSAKQFAMANTVLVPPGAVDEHCVRMQEQFTKHTLLRKSERIRVASETSPGMDAEGKGTTANFLALCTPDWRGRGGKQIRIPWTPDLAQRYPEGMTDEQAGELVYASMVEAGVFGSRSMTKPAKSRWWTNTDYLAAQSVGCIAYGILPESLAHGFPTWDSGAAVGVDESDDYRLVLKSKVWRAKKFTSSFVLCRLSAVALFSSEPLDRLSMRVQHETEHILLDLLHDDTNPFREAQEAYRNLLTLPVQNTCFAVLYHFFAPTGEDAQALAALLLNLNLTMSALLWILCEVALKILPFPLAGFADVRTPDKLGLADWLLNVPLCCRDPGCSRKVTAARQTPESLVGDKNLMSGFGLIARKGNIENMALERLLALIRQVCPKGTPTCERLCSAGFLAQILQIHRAAGGQDPWLFRRADLQEKSAPTRNAATASGANKRPWMASGASKRPWMYYADEKIAERKKSTGKISRAAYHNEKSRLAREYSRLAPEQMARYEDLAVQGGRLDLPRMEQETEAGETREEQYQRRIADRLWGFSDCRQPIRADVVEKIAVQIRSSGDDGQHRAGYTMYQVSICTYVSLPLSRSLDVSPHHPPVPIPLANSSVSSPSIHLPGSA